MVEFNNAYWAPFGTIKGPEFVFSMVSWALAAEVCSRTKNMGSNEEKLFILIIGVIVWLFTIVWFTVNMLSSKIMCGPMAYVALGVIHFLLGCTVLAAGVWAASKGQACWYESSSYWGHDIEVCHIDRNLQASGACGIITGLILIIDAITHICQRNRDVTMTSPSNVTSSLMSSQV